MPLLMLVREFTGLYGTREVVSRVGEANVRMAGIVAGRHSKKSVGTSGQAWLPAIFCRRISLYKCWLWTAQSNGDCTAQVFAPKSARNTV